MLLQDNASFSMQKKSFCLCCVYSNKPLFYSFQKSFHRNKDLSFVFSCHLVVASVSLFPWLQPKRQKCGWLLFRIFSEIGPNSSFVFVALFSFQSQFLKLRRRRRGISISFESFVEWEKVVSKFAWFLYHQKMIMIIIFVPKHLYARRKKIKQNPKYDNT